MSDVFYSDELFPFLEPLKKNWRLIREEYNSLAHHAVPYPQAIHNKKWTAIGLKFQDDALDLRKQAPLTSAICESLKGIHSYGFSILAPGCEIDPHFGITTKVLRAHLGLYVNPDCALCVGPEIRHWKEGELLIFDDSILHYAWNRGSTTRVVLLFDFYRDGNDRIRESDRLGLKL